jgi:hypothetical protein
MGIKRLLGHRCLKIVMLTACFFLPLTPRCKAQTNYLVKSNDLVIRFSGEGNMIGIYLRKNSKEKRLLAFSSVEGCFQQGKTIVHRKKNGSIEFSKILVSDSLHNPNRNSCVITEKFIPTGSSIRWELEVDGQGLPWNSGIQTVFNYPATEQTRFWTAWGAPPYDPTLVDKTLLESLQPVPGGSEDTIFIGRGNNQWTDPLHAIPFSDTAFYYGLPYFTYEHPRTFICPFQGNLFCIPMCSVLEPKEDAGITIALSPEDDIIDLVMKTQQNGSILFSRLFNRISRDHPLKFSLDIISHAADWRAGLGWIATRYSNYFQPENKQSYQLGGTGAYSNPFEKLDIAKLRDMDFKTNWQASFDFPYMGMFLPPIEKGRRWKRFGEGTISVEQMNDYARRMEKAGFHVLNYFNVTEFGTRMKYPSPPDTIKEKADWWKDANTFLYKHFPDALLLAPLAMKVDQRGKTQPGGPIYTWEGAVVTDCGEPAYRDFLLDQALRHIREIPDAEGICIDRIDWLRLFNEHADDGKTWFEDKPVRSLIHSFKQLMDTLGPMMHHAHKSIFENNHDKRIDIMNQADGIFDEFTYAGAPLNLSAFLCLEKPALGWTDTASTVKNEGSDNFFQKYLYMGVFPMCPYPGNDHSILPDAQVDGYYSDYGPLLRLLNGRKWVLKSHVIKTENNLAKVNLFEIQGGYVVPVVFGKTDHVRVIIDEGKINLHGQRASSYKAWHPGKDKTVLLSPVRKRNLTYLDVPLVRGCAMVSVTGNGNPVLRQNPNH